MRFDSRYLYMKIRCLRHHLKMLPLLERVLLKASKRIHTYTCIQAPNICSHIPGVNVKERKT